MAACPSCTQRGAAASWPPNAPGRGLQSPGALLTLCYSVCHWASSDLRIVTLKQASDLQAALQGQPRQSWRSPLTAGQCRGHVVYSQAASVGQTFANSVLSRVGLQKARPSEPVGMHKLGRGQDGKLASGLKTEGLSLRLSPGCQVQEAHSHPCHLGNWREPDGHGRLSLDIPGSVHAHRPKAGPQRLPGLFSTGCRVRQGTGQVSHPSPTSRTPPDQLGASLSASLATAHPPRLSLSLTHTDTHTHTASPSA